MRTIFNAPLANEAAEPASLPTSESRRGAVISGLSASQPAPSITVAELVNLYLDHVRLRQQLGTFSGRSVERVTRFLADFAKFNGEKRLEQCRSSDLTKWLLDKTTWRSDATKADAITSVMVAFRWAARERYIPYVPYHRPKGLTLKPRPRTPLSPEEFRRFMGEARNRKGKRRRPSSYALRKSCFFLWRTGARTQEMRIILWPDIIWPESPGGVGIARLAHHKTEHHGEDRLFPLDPAVIRLLRRIEKAKKWDPRPCGCELTTEKNCPHRIDDHVFLSGRHSAWTRNTFSALFRTFANRAGIDPKKSGYCMRHGFTVRAIRTGLSDRQIADLLGQKGTALINWYGRASRQQSDHLCDLISRVNAPKPSRSDLPLFPK